MFSIVYKSVNLPMCRSTINDHAPSRDSTVGPSGALVASERELSAKVRTSGLLFLETLCNCRPELREEIMYTSNQLDDEIEQLRKTKLCCCEVLWVDSLGWLERRQHATAERGQVEAPTVRISRFMDAREQGVEARRHRHPVVKSGAEKEPSELRLRQQHSTKSAVNSYRPRAPRTTNPTTSGHAC